MFCVVCRVSFFFVLNDAPATAIYTLSLHDALPIFVATGVGGTPDVVEDGADGMLVAVGDVDAIAAALERLAHDPELRRRLGERSEEHTSELQSRRDLVCRLLLEKKKKQKKPTKTRQ